MRSDPPRTSIVVPCLNEKEHIETCVRSLLAQEPPPGGFEVIIADGMSDDGTRDILQRLAAEDPRLRMVDNPERITPCGMNAGIRHAEGEFIAIMGAHNHYAPDYLVQSVKVLEETGADNVGGAMICRATTPLQEAIALAHHSPFSVGGARWHNVDYEGPADTVFGGVYRRKIFDRIGLLDTELVRNQDDELNLRLARAGGKIWQSPRIRSWYTPRNSLRGLFRQYMQYGYWKVRVIQKHRIPSSVRHLVPATFIAALLVLFILGFWRPAAWVALVLISSLYVAINLGASVITAARGGWSLLPLLPTVFACYHLGYCYGFLRGLVDFVLLHRRPAGSFTTVTRAARPSPADK